MSYFRRNFNSFEEFQRESFFESEELGREELELLRELEEEDEQLEWRARRRQARWLD